MTGVAIYFHNIPGAMMRVLNCFTRRGLLLQAVWCAPVEESYRATVLVEASTSTIDQTVRELESTVGVDSVELLEKPRGRPVGPVASAGGGHRRKRLDGN